MPNKKKITDKIKNPMKGLGRGKNQSQQERKG